MIAPSFAGTEPCFTKQGYTVLTAADGLEAMEVCKKFSDPIQLLITNRKLSRKRRVI